MFSRRCASLKNCPREIPRARRIPFKNTGPQTLFGRERTQKCQQKFSQVETLWLLVAAIQFKPERALARTARFAVTAK